MICKNCSTDVTLNYCPSCGAAVQLKRIDSHYIQHEIEHIFHFERGILYTIKELLLRPGLRINEFLKDNRNRLVKPIIFIIVTSALYSFFFNYFQFEQLHQQYSDNVIKSSSITTIFKWIETHYGYANIISGIFMSFLIKLFFRKHGYNFYEILIMYCFVSGIGMLILAVFLLFEGLTGLDSFGFDSAIIFIYTIWAIGQFFDKTKISSYIKAFFAYTLGFILMSISILVFGLLFDKLINL